MTLQEFKEKMRSVFCQESGIHSDLFDQLRVISDLDISVGGDIDSELYDILGWDYKRFRHSANDNIYALVLENEDGSVWQAIASDSDDPRGYKYRTPKDNGNRIYTPPIPESIREAIGDRNGIDVPLHGSFWDWYRDHPEVNLVPTEGGKKALASLTDGFVSIAVYGATCLKSPDLIPYLKDRNVAIALDRDTKESAKATVSQGKRLGDWFARKNGAKSVIWVDWNPEDGKGLDDLKVAGILVSVLEEAFNNFGDPDLQGGKPHFWSTPERGLVWESYKKVDETGGFKKSLTTIGNHLVAIAYVDNVDKNGASIYIEFKTQRNQIVRWILPRKDLVGKSDIIAELLARSYWFRVRERAQLVEYLIGLGSDIEKTYTITDRTGWVNKSFVLPNRTHGDDTLKFKDIEPIKDTAFECKGTLEDWKSNVAALANGNSRLIFALGGAFSAPLAPLLEVESGGFHLFGATSTGKTSTLKLASSVMGIPSKAIQRWRATANGLEGLAVAHNHLLLPLDEIGQADPRDVGNAAYMLANGQGKTRANKTGDRIVPKTWNLQYLSTGEITLTNCLKSANITVKGGQEIRMLDLPACPVKGYGVLESIGKFDSPADFIHALDTQCDRHCGTALDAYLKQLRDLQTNNDSNFDYPHSASV